MTQKYCALSRNHTYAEAQRLCGQNAGFNVLYYNRNTYVSRFVYRRDVAPSGIGLQDFDINNQPFRTLRKGGKYAVGIEVPSQCLYYDLLQYLFELRKYMGRYNAVLLYETKDKLSLTYHLQTGFIVAPLVAVYNNLTFYYKGSAFR